MKQKKPLYALFPVLGSVSDKAYNLILILSPNMRLKRSNLLYAMSVTVTTSIMGRCYDIECSGSENIPKEGPALLLPKHQSMRDILLEGRFLRNYCHRPGNWIMKYDGLPGVLEYIGAVRVKRMKAIREDIRKIGDREERRQLLEEVREYNQKAMDYIGRLYLNGEIVVAHIEGTRKRGEMNPLRADLLNFTKGIQEKYSLEIPVIPAGIEYTSRRTPRPKIYLRAGKPLDVTTPNIVNIVEQEMRRLSNLE